ncbi:MAG: lipocalin-like domain-containing protein [Xanthobacteraceae bacterium]|nr:lipocalin-like domain-containing protein [Xanthobacteraceae bacterium]
MAGSFFGLFIKVGLNASFRRTNTLQNWERMMVFSRSLSVLAITCAFGFGAPSAIAQDKAQVAGTWSLVSFRTADNRDVFGASPKGTLILTPNGRYAMILVNPDREKKWTGKSREGADAAELAAAARGLVAQFGEWGIADGGKTLVRKVEGALNPALGGREQRIGLALAGDQLTLTDKASGVSGGDSQQVYRRLK